MFSRKTISIITLTSLVFLMTALGSFAQEEMAVYRITIKNVAQAQPLSPPVVATHRQSASVFKVGQLASDEIEAIAEDGNPGPLVALLSGNDRVTEVINVERPLTPSGAIVGDFNDTVTLEISGRPNDRLSIATMLICSNDGFTGLSSVRLPRRGAVAYAMDAYDAGTEQNTEMSTDIVDPCSALGPVALNGDPNGNENDGVASRSRKIKKHNGIHGDRGDLLSAHDWDGPIAFVIVERIN